MPVKITVDGSYDTSYSSDMFRTLDTHEIAGGNPSMEDSFADYATTGVGAAIVSAGVGLYNTGAALGETIGAWDEGHQLDESDAVNSLMGADAADFYGRHKSGIDVGGLVIGSMVPGLLAIKGLRLLQTAGKVTPAMQAATGMKNADIVMNSVAVESAKKYALQTTTGAPNWFSAPMMKAYAQGYKQQVMEAGVFEAATLLTMNQQATINPDDLSYFDAIGENFWHATTFTLLGGAIGGSIEGVRIFGAVKKHGDAEWVRTNPYKEVLVPSMTGLAPGSKLIELSREAERRSKLGEGISADDWFGRKQLAHGDNIVKTYMLEAIGELNKAGNAGYRVLEDMVAKGSNGQLQSMATAIAGMKDLGNVAVKDLEDLGEFYAKTRTPTTIAGADDVDGLVQILSAEQEEFFSVMKRLKNSDSANLDPNMAELSGALSRNISATDAGFALPSRTLDIGGSFNARMVKLSPNETSAVLMVPDFVGLNRTNIETGYKVSSAYAKATGKEFTQTLEQYADYVFLHELGHIKGNQTKTLNLVQNYITDFHAAGKAPKVLEELITASLRGRESGWFTSIGMGEFAGLKEADQVAVILGKLKGSKDNQGLISNKSIEKIFYYLDPAELLADGAAYMTKAETREVAAKSFKELAKLFNNEGAIARAWEPTKAYLNSRTKEIHSSFLPGIVDVDAAAKVVTSGLTTALHSPALGKTFELNPALFQDFAVKTAVNAKADYLAYDAQWVMASRQTYSTLASTEGIISVAQHNLPIMEKLAVMAKSDVQVQKAFAEGRVRVEQTIKTAGSTHPDSIMPSVVDAGMGNIKVKPINEILHRETNVEGLGDLLRNVFANTAERGSVTPLFVTNNADLAIGQGINKGIKIVFDGKYVSGAVHQKPGTSIIPGGGQEFKTDYINRNGISSITMPKDTKLPSLAITFLKREFSVDTVGDSLVYTYKGLPETAGATKQSFESITDFALPELVKQRKMELRKLLAVSGRGYNEHHISKMLNIDIAHALGRVDAPEEGWMLMGAKDFSVPEVFKVRYDHRSMADYQGATLSMAGAGLLSDAAKSQRMASAAALLGDVQAKFPAWNPALLEGLNPFAGRATLTANLRTEIGSLREFGAYVGKLVGMEQKNSAHAVDMSYASAASVFNRVDSGELRFEFAHVDNILRREHYYKATSAEGNHYVIRADRFQESVKGLFGKYDPQMLHGLPDSHFTARVGAGDSWAPDAMQVSEDLGKFFDEHVTTNGKIVAGKQELARARGHVDMKDPHVLYAPPRDLSKQKYFGLIEPSEFHAGADPRRFMVYGETAAELEGKIIAIKEKYGTKYTVDTTSDRVLKMKAGKTENNLGAFDEAAFDSELFRKGNSSELAPNIDRQTSATLERYRQWTISQKEALIRSGVELHYDDLFQALKGYDKEFAKQEVNTLDKRWKEASTIWKDTAATMLNYRARGSGLEQEFVRVNDFVGNAGSKLLEASLSGFRKVKDRNISDTELAEWNRNLDAKGFQSPFDEVAHVILSSPDTQASTLFPSTVRVLSKLVATTMLRLDQVNSMMQIISTPILTSSVLMEAKRALKGTPAGQRLEGATSVVNPATGVREPSIAMLMASGFKHMFTEEGKLFQQEMKERNIITDELHRFHDATDFSTMNGRHSLTRANDAIDKLAKYGSYVSGGNLAETKSRFMTAWAMKELCEIRGLPKEEAWAAISGAVDKVHGVYSAAQRPQLFQGVIGQSVGLFQTYFFNFAQTLMRGVADGEKRQLAAVGAMQGSIFGIQSLPGFQTLNAAIGESNRKNEDLYSYTNANSGESWGRYAMYGMASHMFGTPVDFSTRGALATRHMLIIPTRFEDMAVVGTVSKALGNLWDTTKLVAGDDVSAGTALWHGLAHNAMNRPLQGVGQIMLGRTETVDMQTNQENINRLGYEANADMNWAAMTARALGTKPLNETIVQNSFYRNAAYRANTVREMAEIGGKIQVNAAAGTITPQSFAGFARDYELAGGEIQTFNAYFGRQLKQAGNGTMSKFRKEMEQEHQTELGRSAFRIAQKQSTSMPWDAEFSGDVGQ